MLFWRFAARARASATLLLTSLRCAYRRCARGARSADAVRGGIGSNALRSLAEETCERAGVENQRRQLLPDYIHALHDLPGSADRRQHVCQVSYRRPPRRRAGLPIKAHRNDIRDRKSYFGTLVHRGYEHRLVLARDARYHENDARRAHEQDQRAEQLTTWAQGPGHLAP